ncbi:YkvA family protein [Methylophilus sp. 5]|uniref:YkvA family protein n=1 Tax=Methylophilus sp. 5 TaxID=1112274 RepID=UPI00048DF6B0|nr:YkvA family protein [Methylophilus sp. 5]
MSLRAQLATLASRFKQEVAFYRALHAHPQTPWLAKALLWLALAYLVLPFDLIPDFIPVIGQLDELVIIPLLLYLALKLTPVAVRQACRDAETVVPDQK